MSKTAPLRVGVFLSKLSTFRLCPPCEPRRLQECSDSWRTCVGEQVALHVTPSFYLNGRLTLAADSSIWLHKLLQQRSALIQQLRQHESLRDLSDIHIRVVPRGENPFRKSVPLPRLSNAARSTIADSADSITDPDLQAALRRLAEGARR